MITTSNSNTTIEQALNKLGVAYTKNRDSYIVSCPIHNSLQKKCYIYPSRDGQIYWKCYTRHCEQNHGSSFVGFIAGTNRTSHAEAKKWLSENVGIESVALSEKDFIKKTQIDLLKSDSVVENVEIPLSEVLPYIHPSDFFLKRGFSDEILEKYKVGRYNKPNDIMFGRHVVPLINENASSLIGLTGRTPFEKCSLCGQFHENGECPEDNVRFKKWIHSAHINLRNYLYNLWCAKPHIQSTGKVILVEGPCDVWRLEQAGIKNSLAILGTNLHKEKRVKLIELGVREVVLMFDNDEAGQKLTNALSYNLSKIFRIKIPKYEASDVAELTIREIQNLNI